MESLKTTFVSQSPVALNGVTALREEERLSEHEILIELVEDLDQRR